MDYIKEEILSGELLPVLLGVSLEVGETAHRLYRQYGVISHVFCDHVPLSLRLSLCMKFHTVRHTTDERLLLQALEDFATQRSNADVIPYLIPCTEEYANLIWNHHEALERLYVIADRAEMYRVWFGEDLPTTVAKEG